MRRQLRILYVNGGLMDRGGISSAMMNYYLFSDHSKIHIDFAVHGSAAGERDREILESGSSIYLVPPKSISPLGNYLGLKKIMIEGKYDIVHAHADSGNAFILKIAKECGVEVRISHSHNTDFTVRSSVKIMLGKLQKKQIARYATHKWACSTAAGQWLYGKDADFEVIPNAIDTQKFAFDPDSRRRLREKFGLSGCSVVGHIGRFDYQKNQLFLLEAFALAAEQNEKLRLVLVGDGKDRALIEEKITVLGIREKVLLLGQRSDVNQILNMFDLFVFPSKFEGMSVALLEAQANGLKCLCSNLIPEEANITGTMVYLPLESARWCEAMNQNYERDDNSMKIIERSGYSIRQAAACLQKRYFEMVEQ